MGDSWRGDAYRTRGYNDNSYEHDRGPPPSRYDRDRDPPQHEPRDYGSYHFRGAAQPDNYRTHADSYRPQDQRPPDFSFRAAGPPAPHFPPAAPGQYNQQATQRRDRRGNDYRGGGRGGSRGRGRGGRNRAAHARDLMAKSNRAATPEQMEGMKDDGKAYFVDNVSSDEEEDAASTGGDNDEPPSTKRNKTTTARADASSAPKWSNPDPYTVLPPTDMSMAPKKDIVQTIRKAKVEAANKASSANAIKENVDFISFDDFNDETMDEPNVEGSEDGEIEDHGGVDLGFDITPRFDREPSVGVPPPPPEVLIPEARELTMPSYDSSREQRNGGQVGTILSNKRKRGIEPLTSHAGVIVTEWMSDGSNPTPWLREDATFTSHVGLHRLHKELVDFHEFVRPYSFEAECREDLINRVQRAIRSWRGASDVEVRSFGSFASGLYLPTADMDLVAVSPSYLRSGHKSFCQRKNEMWNLSHHLSRTAKKNSMVVIAKAKVPILKFVDEDTDLKVDISFENDSGLRAIDTFLDWKRDYPEAPQLVVIVKQLLAMRGLNEVHSGGIGGFTIICLVVSMFQLMPQEQSRSGNQQGRLGELLLNFLDLYGNKFNRHTTGILMDPPGYFNKQTDYCPARINPTGLTIIDPNRADNDISGGSKQVESVFKCFRGALTLIQHRLDAISKGESDDRSILGCVLGGNYSSFIKQREILRRCAARRQSQPDASFRPAQPAHPLPPPPPARQPPRAPPRAPQHTLPPRPTSQQDYNYSQRSAYAPQPADYMQRPQDYHQRPAYNNYPPPPPPPSIGNVSQSNILTHSRRGTQNGDGGSRNPTESQAGQATGASTRPAEPKKRKGRTKAKKNLTGLQGDPIDLT
ncbi:uncharacterized protein RCC_01833 [Ramularia collo-cygni]|uniref:polynucleotide adenylyltransferase n=1 Tax=Ramularia collo-cygni TaxID=112498 RepID=A0A2D3V6P1_9PEZI|nr:uncharacterized protein RCC_01833 [Ramularia collo-cygni]CZT15993.1 uncharacterized protein RCC_01833 [Ramularia collo-cygni]